MLNKIPHMMQTKKRYLGQPRVSKMSLNHSSLFRNSIINLSKNSSSQKFVLGL